MATGPIGPQAREPQKAAGATKKITKKKKKKKKKKKRKEIAFEKLWLKISNLKEETAI